MENRAFQRIALTGRAGVEGVTETLSALIDYLRGLGCSLILEESASSIIENVQIPCVPADNLGENADLLIVVGGDGSLINAAHMAVSEHLPVLGINRGRLGFLTDIHPSELSKIEAILTGDYLLETRFLLEATITSPSGEPLSSNVALNDVVLLPGDLAQMIEFDIAIDNKLVCSQRADGLIIATPTGSTAYALSGGGPILHPTLDAVVLVPMFPHTLSSRPIVVQGNRAICVTVAETNEASPYVSCDGQTRIAAPPGSKVIVSQKEEKLTLIHPSDYNYYQTLREKLHWEKRATRDSETHAD
jgi:NAD+ kinase